MAGFNIMNMLGLRGENNPNATRQIGITDPALAGQFLREQVAPQMQAEQRNALITLSNNQQLMQEAVRQNKLNVFTTGQNQGNIDLSGLVGLASDQRYGVQQAAENLRNSFAGRQEMTVSGVNTQQVANEATGSTAGSLMNFLPLLIPLIGGFSIESILIAIVGVAIMSMTGAGEGIANMFGFGARATSGAAQAAQVPVPGVVGPGQNQVPQQNITPAPNLTLRQQEQESTVNLSQLNGVFGDANIETRRGVGLTAAPSMTGNARVFDGENLAQLNIQGMSGAQLDSARNNIRQEFVNGGNSQLRVVVARANDRNVAIFGEVGSDGSFVAQNVRAINADGTLGAPQGLNASVSAPVQTTGQSRLNTSTLMPATGTGPETALYSQGTVNLGTVRRGNETFSIVGVTQTNGGRTFMNGAYVVNNANGQVYGYDPDGSTNGQNPQMIRFLNSQGTAVEPIQINVNRTTGAVTLPNNRNVNGIITGVFTTFAAGQTAGRVFPMPGMTTEQGRAMIAGAPTAPANPTVNPPVPGVNPPRPPVSAPRPDVQLQVMDVNDLDDTSPALDAAVVSAIQTDAADGINGTLQNDLRFVRTQVGSTEAIVAGRIYDNKFEPLRAFVLGSDGNIVTTLRDLRNPAVQGVPVDAANGTISRNALQDSVTAPITQGIAAITNLIPPGVRNTFSNFFGSGRTNPANPNPGTPTNPNPPASNPNPPATMGAAEGTAVSFTTAEQTADAVQMNAFEGQATRDEIIAAINANPAGKQDVLVFNADNGQTTMLVGTLNEEEFIADSVYTINPNDGSLVRSNVVPLSNPIALDGNDVLTDEGRRTANQVMTGISGAPPAPPAPQMTQVYTANTLDQAQLGGAPLSDGVNQSLNQLMANISDLDGEHGTVLAQVGGRSFALVGDKTSNAGKFTVQGVYEIGADGPARVQGTNNPFQNFTLDMTDNQVNLADVTSRLTTGIPSLATNSTAPGPLGSVGPLASGYVFPGGNGPAANNGPANPSIDNILNGIIPPLSAGMGPLVVPYVPGTGPLPNTGNNTPPSGGVPLQPASPSNAGTPPGGGTGTPPAAPQSVEGTSFGFGDTARVNRMVAEIGGNVTADDISGIVSQDDSNTDLMLFTSNSGNKFVLVGSRNDNEFTVNGTYRVTDDGLQLADTALQTDQAIRLDADGRVTEASRACMGGDIMDASGIQSRTNQLIARFGGVSNTQPTNHGLPTNIDTDGRHV